MNNSIHTTDFEKLTNLLRDFGMIFVIRKNSHTRNNIIEIDDPDTNRVAIFYFDSEDKLQTFGIEDQS